MKLCENCAKPTKNSKYCCKSCAAQINNKLSPKRTVKRKCKNCENPSKSSSHVYCTFCFNQLKTINEAKISPKITKEDAFSIVNAFINRKDKTSYNEKRRIKRLCNKFQIEIDDRLFKDKKHLKYTKEILEPIVAKSNSYAECLRNLNLIVAGGNYKLLQRNIDKYNLDTSHMSHQAHNKGMEIKKFDDLVGNNSIKRRLIIERGHKCECCLNTKWLSDLITLELEHVDGNNRNNGRANLQLLCPNCHSQTKTWKGRNIKSKIE